MKKNIYTMLMMAMMAMVFTSCENDEHIAYTLEGTWKGNMYISSYYDGMVYDATTTEITFLRDPGTYSSGLGYWVDYYSNAPWDYVANHIEWTVSYGTIKIYFVEEDISMEIWDYSLDMDYFEGSLRDGDSMVDFSLYHTSSPNWNNYRWGYDSWYDDYYYSRTRSAGTDSTTVVEKPKRFLNVK